MTVQDKATLKGYFNTGDVPSEANFADLVDSMGIIIDGMYVMSTFQSLFGAGLIILTSSNGTTWDSPYAAPVYIDGAIISLRDPSIMKYNSAYWVAYTSVTSDNGTGGDQVGGMVTGSSFRIASAPSLRGPWTLLADVATGLGSTKTWAPEWFVDDADGSVSITFSAGAAYPNMSLYLITATNTALTTWGAPTLLLSAQKIDPFLVKKTGTYYLWYKDVTTNLIQYASSSTRTGTYTPQTTGNWAGFAAVYEGECIVQLNTTTWRLYMDHWISTLGIHYSDSSDNWATWSTPVQINYDPAASTHPTDNSVPIYDHATIIRIVDADGIQSVLEDTLTRDIAPPATPGIYLRPNSKHFRLTNERWSAESRLAIKPKNATDGMFLDLFSGPADSSKDIGFALFPGSTPEVIGSAIWGEFIYNHTLNAFILHSGYSGATCVPIVLYTENNPNQLRLNIDGSISVGFATTAGDLLELHKNQAAPTRVVVYNSDAGGTTAFGLRYGANQFWGGWMQYDNATNIMSIQNYHGGSFGLLQLNPSGGSVVICSALEGFYNHAAAAQPTKAGHNNWAAVSDVVAALVAIGIFDAA
jgi:hypothetical protein